MDNIEKVKYFCEVITSNGLVNEVEDYISIECTTRVGENTFYVGVEGMKTHITAVRQTYPDLKMTIIRQYCQQQRVKPFVYIKQRYTVRMINKFTYYIYGNTSKSVQTPIFINFSYLHIVFKDLSFYNYLSRVPLV